jgi:hypothetical protein
MSILLMGENHDWRRHWGSMVLIWRTGVVQTIIVLECGEVFPQ